MPAKPEYRSKLVEFFSYNLSIELFRDVDVYGEVVRKSVLEVVTHERTQGITLVLTLLLNHIISAEDVAVKLCTLALLEFEFTG